MSAAQRGGLRLILCSVTEAPDQPKAAEVSLLYHDVTREPFGLLSAFRAELYVSLTARADALFELTDAMLCADGPVKTLVGLALAAEHRRGHGALYAGLNRGRLEVGRLRRAVAAVPLPKAADGRLVLAVDVTPWLRPDADAVRLEPGADVATVTTAQSREVVERLITAGQWREGGQDVLVVVDEGQYLFLDPGSAVVVVQEASPGDAS
jgi:hypothetical protein